MTSTSAALPPTTPSTPSPAPSLATIELVAGEGERMSWPLAGAKLRIGRSHDAEIRLTDEKVSRNHAELRFEEGGWVVVDLGSANGLFADDKRVDKVVLRSGSRFRVGRSELELRESLPTLSQADRLTRLERCELLAPLSPESRSSLAEALRVRVFPAGAVILAQGGAITSLLFVVSGVVRIALVNEEGGEQIEGRLVDGDFHGERALLPGQISPSSLIAEGEVCLLELPQEKLAEALRKKPRESATIVATFRGMLSPARKTTPIVRIPSGAPVPPPPPPPEIRIDGEDKRLLAAKKKVETLAREGKLPLVVGPPGTGKRTFARAFAAAGPDPNGPFLEVSAAELSGSALEEAIFGLGPEEGGRPGHLEMLGSGTLVVSHAERLDPHLQRRILDYDRLGWFHRVEGKETIRSSTKIVLLADAASEAEALERLAPEIRERVKPNIAFLPPLSQRIKDIPILAEAISRRLAKKEGKSFGSFSREAIDRLVSYGWPGNVTELENVVGRAVIVAAGQDIIPADLIFVSPPEKDVHRINVLKNERIRTLFRSPALLGSLLAINTVVVLGVMAATLWGGTRPAGHPLAEFATNPGMLLTWIVWFPILPVTAFLVGRIWCGMCPIVGVADFVGRIGRLNLPVPKILKRLDFWGVVLGFLFLDFIEELVGVADKPMATGLLLVVIIGLAVVFTLLYERRTFCRHLCPLAGVLGAYSSMSLAEIRGNKKVCQAHCGQHTCYKGTAEVPGCPMFAYPASIASNAECMMCGNCIRSCDNRGLQVNVRPPLSEIASNSQPILAFSLLSVFLVGLMLKHQFGNLTIWQRLGPGLGWSPLVEQTALFLAALGLAAVPFLLASTLSAAASGESLARNVTIYGIAFVPLAFAGHLAHIIHEVLSEKIYLLLGYGLKLFDSLFRGIPIAGNAVTISPFIAPPVITFLKFVIVSAGFAGALALLFLVARRVSEKNVVARLLPHALVLFLFWAGYLFVFLGSTAPPAATTPAVAQNRAVAAQAPLGR